ncbi:MAG: hypothetical protein IT236_03790 [Bacteroidia bacterium]|nr:hypothetical protein [Bacteroidia bacterium]
MEELSVHSYLEKENLFNLFKAQLQKDFESSGIDTSFESLPSEFEELKSTIIKTLQPLLRSGSSLINILLYRIDISELQQKNYQKQNQHLKYEEVLAELIIKRVLQKVILKNNFSG